VKLGSGNDVLSVQTGGSHEIWSGAGNDQISINNGSVYAGDGDDVIAGGISSDYLDAGADNDTLNGGAGADTLIGGTGDDLYIVDDINDIIIENTDAGTDTVQSLISYTLTDNTENLVLTGTDALNGTGNSLNNTLMGNNGNNYLLGGLGDDTLIANNGDDSLEGEAGNDLLIGGSGADTYLFNRNAGATGQDTIDDTDGLSTITITGTTLAQLTATQQANDLILAIQNSTDTITVKNFFDSNNLASYQLNLDGGVVLDKTALLQLLPKIIVVEGTTGSDVLQGGTENDTYIVNNARDFIKEPTGNSSIDTVQASVSYALLPSLENLTLTGAANLSGTGNSADNIIKGNEGKNRLLAGDGNDTLNGGAGSDTLNGGNGADVMYGGTGNDTFTVQDVADMVIEFANEGYDSVNSFITYTLTANVERLNLENAGGQIDGFGNELDNSLNGNNANNTLVGGAGNDTLEGKGGADTLEGGLGDDTYYVDNTGDVVTELASEGTDKVSSSISYTLTANVEQLFLTGIAGLTGTGNSQDNIIYGNNGNNQLFGDAGNDSLNGGAGNDILEGGLGVDTLVGGAGNDTYIFGMSSDRDLINNNDATGNDKLLFDAGINADQVWLRQLGNDLEVSIIGTANSVKVQNWYSGTANQLDSFQLADGKTLLANEVQTLVEAMAAFAAPALGQTSLTTSQHTALDSVIVASW
jgi:Ca2+-binding RTX toxin-like protein